MVISMEKVFIVGEKRYDKASREFRVFYEDSSNAVTVGTTDTTVYSVPSGKTFYLRSLVVNNLAGTGITLVIKDGTVEKLSIRVPADGSKEITNIVGISFINSVVASVSAGTAVVTVGGEVTEL